MQVSVLFRVALRNLIEHRGKTLIIGSIIAIAVFVLVVGNAMMDTARQGIERAFINNYTGNIMISGIAEGDISLFGVQSVAGLEETPVIPDYLRIRDYLDTIPEITAVTPQISTIGLLRVEDGRIEGIENSIFTVLFGIDASSYPRMFDNMVLIEGAYITPGSEGVVLSIGRMNELEGAAINALREAGVEFDQENPEYPIAVGDQLRIISGLAAGLPRIRIVPLVGIYEMTGISEGVGAELITYVDAQTLRAIEGLSLGNDLGVILDQEQTELLDRITAAEAASASEESLFIGDLFGESLVEEPDTVELDFESLDSLLGSREAPAGSGAESSATFNGAPGAEKLAGTTWQYLLVRVDTMRHADRVIARLNSWFESEGIAAQAGNWEEAAGPFATTADVIRTVFNIAIIIIGVVAVIIIMNTMVISIMERTREIGTMRALGAQKGFVWRMFMYETLVTTTLFGVVGVLLALGIIGVMHLIAIPATNTFLTILYAGPELKPVASGLSVIVSLLIVSAVGLLAHLYPVSVALKIQPVRAIQTE